MLEQVSDVYFSEGSSFMLEQVSYIYFSEAKLINVFQDVLAGYKCRDLQCYVHVSDWILNS